MQCSERNPETGHRCDLRADHPGPHQNGKAEMWSALEGGGDD